MRYYLLGNLVLTLHFLWILFLIPGFPVILYLNRPFWRKLHLVGLLFALLIQSLDFYCPLTHLEEFFRKKFDPAFSYQGSFISAMLSRLIYIESVSPATITLFTVLFVALVLASFWFRPLNSGNAPKPEN
jgi:hypothetical protein